MQKNPQSLCAEWSSAGVALHSRVFGSIQPISGITPAGCYTATHGGGGRDQGRC